MLGMVRGALRTGLQAIGRSSYAKNAGVGAAAGGVYGMFSNDTSVMGGAMMGAGMGMGLKASNRPMRGALTNFRPKFDNTTFSKATRPPVGGAAGRTAGTQMNLNFGGGAKVAPTAAPFQKNISSNNAVNSTPPYARGRAGVRQRTSGMRNKAPNEMQAAGGNRAAAARMNNRRPMIKPSSTELGAGPQRSMRDMTGPIPMASNFRGIGDTIGVGPQMSRSQMGASVMESRIGRPLY